MVIDVVATCHPDHATKICTEFSLLSNVLKFVAWQSMLEFQTIRFPYTTQDPNVLPLCNSIQEMDTGKGK
jgi:hypothetical protein